MLTRVPYVANGQGGTDEGSIGGIDETIDSMTNAAEISVGVCWAGGEILSLTSRLNESYKTLQLRGTEGPNCKPVSGHSVSLHLGTHLTLPPSAVCQEPLTAHGRLDPPQRSRHPSGETAGTHMLTLS